MKILVIRKDDSRYPKEFLAIEDAPEVIYAMGKVELLSREKKVAIIGARETERRGTDIAYDLGAKYAKEGVVVVSGLALGCDAAAHQGCLDAGGETIAIVATGLNLVHPRENTRLQEQILGKGGLVISEQPFNIKASGKTLVARNRLQAALSEKVIVAECPEKSGTMYTVQFAKDYGKKVSAVKFKQVNEACGGNEKVIREGGEIECEK